MNEIELLKKRIAELEGVVYNLFGTDRFIFQRHIQLSDGKNIQTSPTTGTKIGTATTQKIGFFNTTPVAQRGDVGSNDGTLGSVATQANGIRTVLRDLGLMA